MGHALTLYGGAAPGSCPLDLARKTDPYTWIQSTMAAVRTPQDPSLRFNPFARLPLCRTRRQSAD